jgi:Phosphodiester glycosidase
MTIIEAPHGFEVFFDSGATHTARDLYISGSTVINGSYFWVTDSGVYYPAWYWEKFRQSMMIPGIWKQLNPVYDDPNITHFVGISWSELKIFANSEFKRNAGPYDFSFQAGPLILSGNTLQDFGKSWHANEPHERTLVGKTQSGKVYFFLSRKQLSLTEAGEQIRLDPRFWQDPITVLNLDGWPSTAYYDGIHGFREDKNLPIFFKIRP